jgi:hypothetical protein
MNTKQIEELKEAVEAAKTSGQMWEDDFRSLCEAVGQSVDVESSDCAVNVAIERITTLKDIAHDIAAHSECQCDNADGSCMYCRCVKITDEIAGKSPEPTQA